MKCSSRPAPATASVSMTRSFAPPARSIAANAAEVFERADLVVKVKEPQPARVRDAAHGPGAVHLSAPGCGSRAGEGADEVRRDRDRLRDRHRAQRLAAAADADERGGGTHVDPGGCREPAEGERRLRRAAGRRARRAAGQGGDPRRRRLRHPCRGDGGRPARGRHRRRPLGRSPARAVSTQFGSALRTAYSTTADHRAVWCAMRTSSSGRCWSPGLRRRSSSPARWSRP